MKKPPEITLVLDRLRSAHNVGNIFRIAEAVRAREVICCGYTPCPPHPKLAKTAMETDKMVPYRWCRSSLEAIRQLRLEGVRQVLAAEWNEKSVPVWRQEYRFPIAIVLGNEALGVSEDTLAEVDGCIGIPMFGEKSSINVGNAAAAIVCSILAAQDITCG